MDSRREREREWRERDRDRQNNRDSQQFSGKEDGLSFPLLSKSRQDYRPEMYSPRDHHSNSSHQPSSRHSLEGSRESITASARRAERESVRQRGEGARPGLVQDISGYYYPEDAALAKIESDKFSFEEAFYNRTRCCEASDLIIYTLFLAIPFVFVFCWLLLPSNGFYTYSAFSGCMYLMSFLVWQAFFDMLLPGLSIWLYLTFFVIFNAGMCGLYAAFYFTNIYTEKYVYLTVEAWGVLCGLTCYAIHILSSKVHRRAPKFVGAAPIGRDKTTEGAPDDGRVRIANDALTRYTTDLEEQARKERGETFDDLLERYDQEDHHISRFCYNPFCYFEIVDWNKKRYSSTFGVRSGWVILLWGFVFRVAMFVIWVYLSLFTDTFVRKDYFHDRATALALLVAFQASRIILFQVMLILNEKLPQVKELKYFSTFSIFVLFLMFYRNMFFSINAWWIVIAISIITFVWQILFYPVQMSRWFWNLRCVKWRDWAMSKNIVLRGLAKLLCPDPDIVTYKKYVTQLACEYYYEEIGTYLSIVAILIFFPGVKYVVQYNTDAYPFIDDLSDTQVRDLWLRYLYMFGAEAVSDFIIRCIIHFGIKVDPTHTGKGLTVLNYRTRFLFAMFVAYYMMCCYYSLIKLDNFSSM